MDMDKKIRYEVRMWSSPVYRAEVKRLKALEHLSPEETNNAVFDVTPFGERLALEYNEEIPSAFDKPEPSDLYRIERLEKEEACDLLGIRQRDPDQSVS